MYESKGKKEKKDKFSMIRVRFKSVKHMRGNKS